MTKLSKFYRTAEEALADPHLDYVGKKKAEIILKLNEILENSHMTNSEASRHFGIGMSVIRLIRIKSFSDLSLDRVLRLADSMGLFVAIVVPDK